MEMKIIDMNIYDFCNFVKNFLRWKKSNGLIKDSAINL